MARTWIAVWLAWISVLGASLCQAAGSDAGRDAESPAAAASRLGNQGATAYEAGNYAQALAQFEQAFALLPAPTLGLWAARSYVKLGRLVEGAQRYQQVPSLSNQIGDPAIQRRAQVDAEKELAELSERIPQLGVRSAGIAGPVLLTLDGQPFESEPGQLKPVDPGQHVLLGTYREQRVSVAVELALGERRELVLAFPEPVVAVRPAAAAEPVGEHERQRNSAKAWRTAGWVALGAGSAVLLTGIITHAVAQSRYDTLQEQPGCTRTQCPPEQRDRIDSYNSMRSVSLLTTIGGAVIGAAGAGVLIFVVRPAEGVSLSLSPITLAVSGRF